jgi:hypothetical protein
MSRAVEELRQIPFSHLIGAPLKAAIEAQALAAQSTIDFIQKIGFQGSADPQAKDLLFDKPSEDADAGTIRNITFTYKKKDEAGEEKDFKLSVPLLTITPIPYIRIDEMTIDFKAKLTDMIQSESASQSSVSASSKGKFSAFWSPVKMEFRASATYKTTSSTAASQKREYSMDIHVRAVQDEMPGGLSKILDILEDAVSDKGPKKVG